MIYLVHDPDDKASPYGILQFNSETGKLQYSWEKTYEECLTAIKEEDKYKVVHIIDSDNLKDVKKQLPELFI